MPFIVIVLLLAAAVGGGTSVAARYALPGDPLWEFKVSVNEKVGAAIAASAKARADFDVALLEARMKEAATLIGDTRLTAEATDDLVRNLTLHAASLQEQITTLQLQGNNAAAADAAARFQAAMAGGASLLADAAAQWGGETDAKGLLTHVRETLDTASELSAEAAKKAASRE